MARLSRRQTLGMLSALPVLGITGLSNGAPAAAAPGCFTLFDSTQYEDYGAPDTDVSTFLGIQESTTLFCDGRWYQDYFKHGTTPPKAEFRAFVQNTCLGRLGPAVLNAESIFLRNDGRAPSIPDRIEIWTTLLTWTREALSTNPRPVGAYAFPESTDDEYFDDAAPLVRLMDALFPSLYIHSLVDTSNDDDIYNNWVNVSTGKIIDATNLDKTARPGQTLLPKYPYLWPNFEGGPRDSQFIPAAMWRKMLNFLSNQSFSRADGAVLWSSQFTPDITDSAWLNETKDFILDDPCS